jgi:DNA-binding response OmpR family regulator
MHIVVVEDEIKLALIIKEGLETEGYSVTLFHDGETAEIELLQNSRQYSLVILDLMLPKKNGFEVCSDLRKAGISLPILILTARESIEDKVRVLDAGADDFLIKPFSFDELLARLRALDRRSKGRIVEEIKIKDLCIQTNIRKVVRDGTEIVLTPTEFDVLKMLVDQVDTVLSRDEISTKLWGNNEVSFSNIVDVHISNLRKKIDDNYDTKIIRTVRGMGYSIQK